MALLLRSRENILPYFGEKFDYEKLVAIFRGMCVYGGGGAVGITRREGYSLTATIFHFVNKKLELRF